MLTTQVWLGLRSCGVRYASRVMLEQEGWSWANDGMLINGYGGDKIVARIDGGMQEWNLGEIMCFHAEGQVVSE